MAVAPSPSYTAPPLPSTAQAAPGRTRPQPKVTAKPANEGTTHTTRRTLAAKPA